MTSIVSDPAVAKIALVLIISAGALGIFAFATAATTRRDVLITAIAYALLLACAVLGASVL